MAWGGVGGQSFAGVASAVFPRVPQAQNPDLLPCDLIAQLIVADEQVAHLSRQEVRQRGAEPRLGRQYVRSGYPSCHYGGGNAGIGRRKEIVQAPQVSERRTGPDYFHVGRGWGFSEARLAAQSFTS